MNARTDRIFGFDRPEHEGINRRYGGLGEGPRFATSPELAFSAKWAPKLGSRKPRKPYLTLVQDEADVAAAARSHDAIVLTAESPDKRGPLKTAAGEGRNVVFLRGLNLDQTTLHDFIQAQLSDLAKPSTVL